MTPNSPSGPNGADGTAPSPSESGVDPLDLLRQDLKGGLAVIRGHAQLLLVRVAPARGSRPRGRARLLAREDLIDAAIIGLAVRIDRIGREGPTGSDGKGDEGRELRLPR